jgi:hypothetical protein
MVSGPFIRQEGEVLKENLKLRLIIRIEQIKCSVMEVI